MQNLVEGTPYLSTSNIKRDLLKCRKWIENISGEAHIGYGIKQLECNFWFEYKGESTFFVYSVDGNEPQEILISERELLFGTMNYFVCSCGKRCQKLYLPDGATELKCRACYKLVYELSTINRISKHGMFLYKTNRTLKLANQRMEMSRIFYKSRYTKKFQRFLKLCAKAGLSKSVESARELMESIQNQ